MTTDSDRNHEPTMSDAMSWWSELPAKWTPVGWKDHIFRFNILYNGMISAIPDLNPRTQRWTGQGMQLGVWPNAKVGFPGHVIDPQDNASVLQGWDDVDAPVLWSEWAHEGLLLRSRVFAHVPTPEEQHRGDEPIYAWIRLSIHDVLPALPVPAHYGFNLLLSAPYIRTGAMSIRYNIAVEKDKRRYPRELTYEPRGGNGADGGLVTEPDGRIRIGVASGHEFTVEAVPATAENPDSLVHLDLPTREGCCVDVLLPIFPVERDEFVRELALGWDGALHAANGFWAPQPSTAAAFVTSERHIDETVRHNLKLTRIIAERDPATGYESLLTGSWAYADLWSTPACMQIVMFLDALGHHETAARYLQMYIDSQGSVLPVGDFYRPHPGSLGPPKSIAACVWTADHGAIIWALANHGLVTGDDAWLETALPVIVGGCEFIRDARRIEGHPGVRGIMPPGVATDMPTHIQSVWADAWAHKGLSTAARLLRRLGDRRAASWSREAADYRRTFREAFSAKLASMPTWTDEEGQRHRLAPMSLYGEKDFELRNAFYLDTGPLVLVFGGLLEADEPAMLSTVKWFREGPPRRIYRYDSDCWQVPSLHHEMSSCEPCYSWNVFHSHQLGDREHFLEAMYSLLAGAISRQTYTVCETRGGVTGLAATTIMVYLARLAVVDDQVAEGELHLLRMMPLAWLREGCGSRFLNMPTEYGPVSLEAHLAEDGRTLHVRWDPRFRRAAERVLLHVPPAAELGRILVNGDAVPWDGACPTVDLP